MKPHWILFIFLVVLSSFAVAQEVSTLSVEGINGPNGLLADNKGNLYIANETGRKVTKVSPKGEILKTIKADSPNGLCFDNADRLYISNFFSGIILRVTDSKVDTLVKGLDKPADIKWDAGYLYASLFQRGEIARISETGNVTTFMTGLSRPFGLCFDANGNLYVASNNTGFIVRITKQGNSSNFSRIPGGISFLAYSKKTNRIYATSFSAHGLFFVEKNGEARHLSGKGSPGYKDGDVSIAEFDSPNSICLSSQGIIYISEHNAKRIRKITQIE